MTTTTMRKSFEFGNAGKQRTWWSDVSLSWDEDDDDAETIDGFGILEGSIGFSSIFKVFRAFGWMVPAVIVSMLLGTGTNGFFMALSLSFVADTLWGRPTDRARQKSRKPRSTFAGGADNRKQEGKRTKKLERQKD